MLNFFFFLEFEMGGGGRHHPDGSPTRTPLHIFFLSFPVMDARSQDASSSAARDMASLIAASVAQALEAGESIELDSDSTGESEVDMDQAQVGDSPASPDPDPASQAVAEAIRQSIEADNTAEDVAREAVVVSVELVGNQRGSRSLRHRSVVPPLPLRQHSAPRPGLLRRPMAAANLRSPAVRQVSPDQSAAAAVTANRQQVPP